MAKSKVISRDDDLKNKWLEYFKNIKKENDLIRVILNYCSEIDSEITKLIKNSEKSDNSDKKENSGNVEVAAIPDCELRRTLSIVRNTLVQKMDKIEKGSEDAKQQYSKKYAKIRQYTEILKEVHKQTLKLKPKTGRNGFSALSLLNFKGFSVENTVKIKPITLIYGPNSYGKSSILQSLLLLNQTANEGKDYKNVCLLTSGSMVDLGTFNDILNKNSEDKTIKIELTLPYEHYFDDDEIDYRRRNLSMLSELSFCLYFALNKDNKIILPQIDIFEKGINYSDPEKPVQLKKELLYTFKQNNKTNNNLYEKEFLPQKNTSQIKDEVSKKSFFMLDEFMAGKPFERLEDVIKNIVYVSSFRNSPQRYYVPQNNRRVYVGKNGEYTAEILGYDLGVNKYVNEWLYKIAGYNLSLTKDGKVNSVNLYDTKTNVKDINLLDLGSGIAQVLPIITQAFKSKDETILIEEPEIHLHPKAQAALGEMFKEAVVDAKTGNTFIIETHSENLLLRLEKLVRQGKFSKDDLSVIYVDKNENGSYCIPLKLDDEGDIENINDVPDGFFEEGFDEIFDVVKEDKG